MTSGFRILNVDCRICAEITMINETLFIVVIPTTNIDLQCVGWDCGLQYSRGWHLTLPAARQKHNGIQVYTELNLNYIGSPTYTIRRILWSKPKLDSEFLTTCSLLPRNKNFNFPGLQMMGLEKLLAQCVMRIPCISQIFGLCKIWLMQLFSRTKSRIRQGPSVLCRDLF